MTQRANRPVRLWVPEQFEYLLPALDMIKGMGTVQDIESFVENIGPDDLALLSSAYAAILKKNHSEAVSMWTSAEPSSKVPERNARWTTTQLLFIFDRLANKRMSPFDSRQVKYIERKKKTANWLDLPEEVSYVIPYAKQYGAYDDDTADPIIDAMTGDDLNELAMVAERMRMNGHARILRDWKLRFPITEYIESAMLNSLIRLLDDLDFKFD